jgi:hypothetical protein
MTITTGPSTQGRSIERVIAPRRPAGGVRREAGEATAPLLNVVEPQAVATFRQEDARTGD